MSYRAGTRGEHLTSKGYLEYIDQRLGFSRGTIYDLCLSAIKSKTESKSGVKVTYRGETERMTPHHSVQVRKAIFLIEYKMTKTGKQIDRVVQVQTRDIADFTNSLTRACFRIAMIDSFSERYPKCGKYPVQQEGPLQLGNSATRI